MQHGKCFHFFRFFLIAITVTLAVLVQQNPLLFGLNGTSGADDTSRFHIYTHNTMLEQHLERYRLVMGEKEYAAYKNHCLRVLTFAAYHLENDLPLLNNRTLDLMAMALAYHDIALWSDSQLDYLQPSVKQLEAHVNSKFVVVPAKSMEWSAEEVATAREIVLQHHKLTEWKRKDTPVVDAKLVNAVRKGDWADATMGLIRFGLPESLLKSAYEQIPEAGFHRILMEMGPRLSPNSLVGQLDVLKILKW